MACVCERVHVVVCLAVCGVGGGLCLVPCVCMHACVCVCVCVCVHGCVCVWLCLVLCVHACMCVGTDKEDAE